MGYLVAVICALAALCLGLWQVNTHLSKLIATKEDLHNEAMESRRSVIQGYRDLEDDYRSTLVDLSVFYFSYAEADNLTRMENWGRVVELMKERGKGSIHIEHMSEESLRLVLTMMLSSFEGAAVPDPADEVLLDHLLG